MFYERSKETYIGDWVNDMRWGKGKVTHPDKGTIYEGDFKEDSFHGEGVFENHELILKGEFVTNTPMGYGECTYKKDGSVYQGMWMNGRRRDQSK